ncbi:unnamed protein product, partial [Prorocentrum cordatum]
RAAAHACARRAAARGPRAPRPRARPGMPPRVAGVCCGGGSDGPRCRRGRRARPRRKEGREEGKGRRKEGRQTCCVVGGPGARRASGRRPRTRASGTTHASARRSMQAGSAGDSVDRMALGLRGVHAAGAEPASQQHLGEPGLRRRGARRAATLLHASGKGTEITAHAMGHSGPTQRYIQ